MEPIVAEIETEEHQPPGPRRIPGQRNESEVIVDPGVYQYLKTTHDDSGEHQQHYTRCERPNAIINTHAREALQSAYDNLQCDEDEKKWSSLDREIIIHYYSR